MKQTIKHQFSYNHSPETVWNYLTKPELVEQWLMENNFQLVVGNEFQFRTDPVQNLDFDGIFYCKVLEIDPFKKLSYSWNTTRDGKINLESVVVWTLQRTATGTELVLEHSGFDKEENLSIFHALNKGWVAKFTNIEKLINAVQHDTTQA